VLNIVKKFSAVSEKLSENLRGKIFWRTLYVISGALGSLGVGPKDTIKSA